MERLRAWKGKRVDLNVNFQDEDFDSLTIVPTETRKKENKKKDMAIDAPPIYEYDVQTNTDYEFTEREIQTNPMIMQAEDDEDFDPEDEQFDQNLFDFLNSVYPKLSFMLESNLKNNATFELFEKVVADSSKDIWTLYGLKTNFEFIEQTPKMIGEEDKVVESRKGGYSDEEDDDWE
jgi:hypothetical protein